MVGDIDLTKLVNNLRKKVGHADIISVSGVKEDAEEEEEENIRYGNLVYAPPWNPYDHHRYGYY